MAAQDRRGAVELLRQHDAHQLVRPGEGRKAQGQVGARDEIGIEPVGAADDEADAGPAVVAPVDELLGEAVGVDGFATLVQGDQPDITWEMFMDGARLVIRGNVARRSAGRRYFPAMTFW